MKLEQLLEEFSNTKQWIGLKNIIKFTITLMHLTDLFARQSFNYSIPLLFLFVTSVVLQQVDEKHGLLKNFYKISLEILHLLIITIIFIDQLPKSVQLQLNDYLDLLNQESSPENQTTKINLLYFSYGFIQINCLITVYYKISVMINLIFGIMTLTCTIVELVDSDINIMFLTIMQFQNLVFMFMMCILYLILDQKLKDLLSTKENAEIETMKVIHDIKNPVFAIQQIIKDPDQTFDQVKKHVLSEATDITEMLENLRFEFKQRNGMDFNEQADAVNSKSIAESLKWAHSRLAENGSNRLDISLADQFPHEIKLPKVIFKRVLNNLISNALKHTIEGVVDVQFSVATEDVICQIPPNCIQIGSDPNLTYKYFKVEVNDTGKGIQSNDLYKIFEEKNSDQSEGNWDGTGLGLPICKILIERMNGFLRQTSTVEVGSKFSLFVPLKGSIKKITTGFRDSVKCDSRHSESTKDTHVCSEILLAEDNEHILKNQARIFKKYNIPFKCFVNGKLCYEYIKNILCQNCHKILVLTDQMMPQMNGVELATVVSGLIIHQKIEVSLATAGDIDNYYKNLFQTVHSKPVSALNLKELQYNFYSESKIPENFNEDYFLNHF